MHTIMFIQPKGGVGASAVAVAAALLAARHGDVLLVDPAGTGDHNAILGAPMGDEDLQMTDRNVWLSANVKVTEVGVMPFDTVVIDGGVDPDRALVEMADEIILVTDPSYLALRRARRLVDAGKVSPCRVIVVRDPTSALGSADAEAVLGLPAIEVARDPAVARAIDAGLFAQRLPASLARSLATAMPSP